MSSFDQLLNLSKTLAPRLLDELVDVETITTFPYNNYYLCCLVKEKCYGGYTEILPGILVMHNYDYAVKVKKTVRRTEIFKVNLPPPVDNACIIERDPGIKYIGIDAFSNEFFISILMDFLSDSPFFVRHRAATFCGSSPYLGITVMEYCEFGNLNTISKINDFTSLYTITFSSTDVKKQILVKPEICAEILRQVVLGLQTLQQEFNFLSGNLTIEHVLVSNKPVTYQFLGKEYQANFTCKISSFSKSSISIEGKRLFNYDAFTGIYLKLLPFKGVVAEDSTYMVSKTFAAQNIAEARGGVPYYASYDIYTFMLSLMLNDRYRQAILATEMIRVPFWDILWFDNELDRILKKIYTEKDTSYTNIVSMLKGFRLKCEVLDEMGK